MAGDRLFAEFPPVTTEAWRAAVEKDLKGAEFEKRLVTTTLDGLKVAPFARAEDLPPGLDGAARGRRLDGNRWAMREEIREGDPKEANAHALAALQRGADQLAFYGYPIGCLSTDEDTLRVMLDGVFVEMIQTHWLTGPLSPQVLALFVQETDRRGLDRARLSGSVELDPILDECAGWRTTGDWSKELFPTLEYVCRDLPAFGTLTVRGSIFEKAGASLAQELAWTLAVLMEYLVACQEWTGRGRLPIGLGEIVERSELRFGVGTNYFLEIAKFRALKVLLSNVLDAFGVTGVSPQVHAVTTSSNKTIYDPYNNLLRATVEAMAAVVGGIDSLSVAAYDQGYHTPDEFSEHLARNTETVLRDEAHLGRVADPLGGSYSVERLTADLALAAWEELRRIEEAGGFWAAWGTGSIQRELARVCGDRSKSVAHRRRTIVGTTVYPNSAENRLSDVRPPNPALVVAPAYAGTETFERLRDVVRLEGLTGWLTDQTVVKGPLTSFRPSADFEELRLDLERHLADGGRRPVIQLLLFGDAAMRAARAGFCQGFYGVGGYEVRRSVVTSPQEAVQIVLGADLVVLCSADSEYESWVRELRASGIDSPLTVAGYPTDLVDAIKAAGADDFVHLRSDLLGTLRRLHDTFGVTDRSQEGAAR